jgi:hypothetical protein
MAVSFAFMVILLSGKNLGVFSSRRLFVPTRSQ